MKIFTKFVAVAILAVAALGIVSCNTAASGGGAIDTPNPQKVKDEAVVKTVKDTLTVQEIVGKGLNSISLPKDSGGATVTWTSNKSDIIDSEGNVTHKDGTGYDEVELTAKITKRKASVKKTFTVKVAQKNKVLSPDEILDSVTISVNYDTTKYEDQDIDMQESILVEDKTVTIEYTSSNDEKHLRYDSSTKKITIHRDIIDVTAQLSVKLTCEGKEKTKQIPVLVERIPEFVFVDNSGNKTTFAFDGTTLTKTYTSWGSDGSKFSYTVDTKNEIITLSKTHILEQDGDLDINAALKRLTRDTSAFKKAYNQPNLENFRNIINILENESLKNDDELIDYILKDENIREHFDGMTEASTKEEFKALSEDKKTKGIKEFCKKIIKPLAFHNNIPDTLSFTEMIEKLETIISTDIRKDFFKNSKFKYKVSSQNNKTEYPKGVWFEAEYIYDENQNWYENTKCGDWSGISVTVYSLGIGANSYYGKFNSDYTELTYFEKRNYGTGQTDSENGKWIFETPVVDTDGKVSMKAKKSGSSEEVTLKFTPNKL